MIHLVPAAPRKAAILCTGDLTEQIDKSLPLEGVDGTLLKPLLKVVNHRIQERNVVRKKKRTTYQ